MTFTEINGKQVQAESLDGIEKISLDVEDMDLVVESSPDLSNVLHFYTGGGDRFPMLRREGSELRVVQVGRYRNGASIRVPASEIPPIAGSHVKGELSFERVIAPIAVQHGVGTVTFDRGSGDVALDVGKGDLTLRERSGSIAVRSGTGNINIQRCAGPISVTVGKGDVRVVESDAGLVVKIGAGNLETVACSGDVIVKSGAGDIHIARPREQRVSVNTARGNVVIREGSLLGMAIRTVRGDVHSTARMLLPPSAYSESDEELETIIDIPDLEARITRAVEDAISSAGARLNLGEFGIEAGDSGVRITRGGRPVFEADDHGVRFKKGSFAFEASDTGVRIKRGEVAGETSVRTGDFDVDVQSGDLTIDVPYGAPIRIEALVSSGDVRSDIPLVTVGRPGPRGATQRYVGGTNPGDGPRIRLRAKTDRGDIRLRAVHTVVTPSRPTPPTPPSPPMPPEIPSPIRRGVGPDQPTAVIRPAPPPEPLSEREERVQTILNALASGSLSVAEAERLLSALDDKR